MAKETQPYRRSFAGSLGAGMGSLMGGSGKRYYILEHKISTKYHKAGESQEIIVDQIELGRDPKCQVRFDEEFGTVSRRHAAIVKSGDNWKLVQLSTTNSTFLNGRKIEKEWYLQNGDEIQLSVNGPKLGFIIPSGAKSTVGSIGLSRRLSLFRQQALRPYKTAITLLSIFLVLAVGGAFGWNYFQYNRFQEEIAHRDAEFARIIADNVALAQRIADERRRNDSIAHRMDSIAKIARRTAASVPARIEDLIDKCKDDIYFLAVETVYLTDGSNKVIVTDDDGEPYVWSGTGFLLDDGRLVTARHCIKFWRFSVSDRNILSSVALSDTYPNYKMVAVIKAISRTGKQFTFESSDFTVNEQYDKKEQIAALDNGSPLYYQYVNPEYNEKVLSTDWAYVKTTSKGKLTADAALSNNLRSGKELHVLGFPMGIGVGDTPSVLNPPYNKFSVGFDGLDNSGCFLHTRGTEHGNSGGPIFAEKNGKLVVIGIVSRSSSRTDEYNYGIPVSAIGN
ncbi:MAG: FHA domain-containing protein [Prevotellaceae bacterium]|jgi:S1-C subfamily serine protease|nr:FHA domain-containing protein [Prevotellaceae bacterium]